MKLILEYVHKTLLSVKDSSSQAVKLFSLLVINKRRSKLGQICTDFEVKHGNSARMVGIDVAHGTTPLLMRLPPLADWKLDWISCLFGSLSSQIPRSINSAVCRRPLIASLEF